MRWCPECGHRNPAFEPTCQECGQDILDAKLDRQRRRTCYVCDTDRTFWSWLTWTRCSECKADYCRQHYKPLLARRSGLFGSTFHYRCLYCHHEWKREPSYSGG